MVHFPVQTKQNLQTLLLCGDLYLLYYILLIRSHQYHESFLKIHEYLSNKALSAVPDAASLAHAAKRQYPKGANGAALVLPGNRLWYR